MSRTESNSNHVLVTGLLPHPIGRDCHERQNGNHPACPLGGWNEIGRYVECRVEQCGTENRLAATIVDPRNNDGERNQDKHSRMDVCRKGRTCVPREVKWSMPQRPRKPNE